MMIVKIGDAVTEDRGRPVAGIAEFSRDHRALFIHRHRQHHRLGIGGIAVDGEALDLRPFHRFFLKAHLSGQAGRHVPLC